MYRGRGIFGVKGLVHVLFWNLHSKGKRGEKVRNTNLKIKHTCALTSKIPRPLHSMSRVAQIGVMGVNTKPKLEAQLPDKSGEEGSRSGAALLPESVQSEEWRPINSSLECEIGERNWVFLRRKTWSCIALCISVKVATRTSWILHGWSRLWVVQAEPK